MSDLIRSKKSRLTVALATAAVSLGIVAGPASAQQGSQEGLVNVAIVDVLNNNQVNVQVPIGVAANVCGVNVGIIQQIRRAGGTVDCTASNTAELPVSFQRGGPNGPQ